MYTHINFFFSLQRKKASADSTPSPDEPSSLGTSPSPSPKKPRASSVKVREAPDRSTMTMQELIYYNPSANPMRSAACRYSRYTMLKSENS